MQIYMYEYALVIYLRQAAFGIESTLSREVFLKVISFREKQPFYPRKIKKLRVAS